MGVLEAGDEIGTTGTFQSQGPHTFKRGGPSCPRLTLVSRTFPPSPDFGENVLDSRI